MGPVTLFICMHIHAPRSRQKKKKRIPQTHHLLFHPAYRYLKCVRTMVGNNDILNAINTGPFKDVLVADMLIGRPIGVKRFQLKVDLTAQPKLQPATFMAQVSSIPLPLNAGDAWCRAAKQDITAQDAESANSMEGNSEGGACTDR